MVKEKTGKEKRLDNLVKKGEVSPQKGKKINTAKTRNEARERKAIIKDIAENGGAIATGERRGDKVEQDTPIPAIEAEKTKKSEKTKSTKNNDDNYIADIDKAIRQINAQEEIFVNEILRGKTRVEAYLEAYPLKRKLKQSTLSAAASKLFGEPHVKHRYNSLLESLQRDERKITEWTRDEARRTLMDLIRRNVNDADRIEKAYEKESELNYATIKLIHEQMKSHREGSVAFNDLAKDGEKIYRRILKAEKERRMSAVTNDGILKPTIELNNMMGFNRNDDKTEGLTVNFVGWDEIKE